jgi:Transglycosylase-like domain/Putative peptidoglycan binding domain
VGKKIGLALLAVPALSLALAGPASADDPLKEQGTESGGSGAQTAKNITVLRKGDFGRAVARVQRKLHVSADGVFGSQTHKSVKRFQRRKGLESDGVVGPKTRRKLHLRAFKSSEVNHKHRSRGSRVRLPRIMRLIAQCESGGNPRAISRGGTYRGKWQFSRATWRSLGGRGDPAKASESAQDRIAMKLYRRSGTKSWPACSRSVSS